MSLRFKVLSELFFSFFKIGALTFGGGYAMIPLIQREASQNRGWVEPEVILDVVAIAESTPGPISVNAATFIGYRVAKTAGAAAATIGLTVPSLVVITLVSAVYRAYIANVWVAAAMSGMRCCVAAMIIHSAVKFALQLQARAFSFVLGGAAFALSAFLSAGSVPVIVGCGAVGACAAVWLPGALSGGGKGKEKSDGPAA